MSRYQSDLMAAPAKRLIRRFESYPGLHLRKAKPIGDGNGLENRRALVAPLEFDSLALRQKVVLK